ncbi:MAG: lysoplasmalogenase family protein [Woeseiaceae bacterium]
MAAVVALLWAEIRSSHIGIWLTKPVASTLFIVTALFAGALDSTYGQLILSGLLLSWLGDVLLIPKGRYFFVAGLTSFLFAHLAFSGAFYQQSLDSMHLILAALIMSAVTVIVMRWLWPHLSGDLRAAVVAYMAAISLMVVLAAGAMADHGAYIAIGALLFAVSDLFVARERFVFSAVANRLWGLPLYYGAQLIFALSPQWYS